jgi:hypothetical protein
MVKTLSCKVSEEMYQIVDKMDGSHSDILRLALQKFIKMHQNELEKSK